MKKARYLFIILAGLFFYSLFLSTSIRNIYLSSDEGKQALEKLLSEPSKEPKVREWFALDEFDETISNQNITSFVANYYELIFL